MRLTIGRIDPEDEEIEFVDTMMSPERSIFSSKKLIPGEYIILLEVYWEQETHNEITLGTYSQGPVILEKLKKNDSLYNMSEYMIWKCFANQKRNELTKMNPNYIYDKGVNVTVNANKYKNQNYAMVLYDYMNSDSNMTAHQVVGISKSSGFNIVSANKNGSNCDLIMNPGENDVILFKMDPRSQGFSLSHRVVQEELLEKNFSKPYQSAFEMLNELGSIDANPNKVEPKQFNANKLGGLTQHLKDKLLEEQKMKSKAEKIRKMKEAEQKRKQRIEQQREKQYHKSKLGRYDPMNLIFGFQGGASDILKMLENQAITKNWGRQKQSGGRGFFSNFAGLFSRGGQGGGFGFGGGGFGGGGFGFGGGNRGTHSRQKSWGGGGQTYQQTTSYGYTDFQGNQGGYTYNLSNTNSGGKSKLNKDLSGKKSKGRGSGRKKTKRKIVDPLQSENSLFNQSKGDKSNPEEPQIRCGCY